MPKLSRNLATPPGGGVTLDPRETLFLSGVLGALNAELVIPCDGSNTVAIDLRGTFVASLEVSGTVDGVNYSLIPIKALNAASALYLVSATVPGLFIGSCTSYRSIRIRVIAYTSGSVSATIIADNALLENYLRIGGCSPLAVTNTGAAAAAVTLTLPAPGAGLRQYITSLTISKFATALLTAGATPVLVTTTNLPGSPVYNFAADAALAGTNVDKREEFSRPLAASAQNTAVTFVAPAITSIIWRLTATYFVGA